MPLHVPSKILEQDLPEVPFEKLRHHLTFGSAISDLLRHIIRTGGSRPAEGHPSPSVTWTFESFDGTSCNGTWTRTTHSFPGKDESVQRRVTHMFISQSTNCEARRVRKCGVCESWAGPGETPYACALVVCRPRRYDRFGLMDRGFVKFLRLGGSRNALERQPKRPPFREDSLESHTEPSQSALGTDVGNEFSTFSFPLEEDGMSASIAVSFSLIATDIGSPTALFRVSLSNGEGMQDLLTISLSENGPRIDIFRSPRDREMSDGAEMSLILWTILFNLRNHASKEP
ncbi:hypothetical protein NMY22_g7562 [Coprinellus aureogranulatus]|nr:hypothetical protein NMY22_g7562 [Coprinellus aureogranulatus]